MKKTIYYILASLLICIPYLAFGSDCNKSCTIKDGPADELLDYIRDAQIILGNIDTQVGNGEPVNKVEANLDLIKIYNYNIFNWGGFFSSFEYSISLPLSSEVPAEITRDYTIIQNALKNQHNFLYNLALKGVTKTQVSDVCDGVDNCNLASSGSAGYMAAQVIANTNKLISVYRLSVTGNAAAGNIEIDFGENITSNIISKYNQSMLIACSACEGEYSDRINTAIENITTNNGDWNDGVQKWIDGWKLATGETKITNTNTTGTITVSTRDITISNLQKNQDGGIIIDNNFLSNSFKFIKNNTTDNTDEFEESKDNIEDSVNVLSFESTRTDVDRTQEIDTIIETLHRSLEPFAGPQNNSSNTSLARVVEMHNTLTNILKNSINSKTISNAEKACNRQHTGEGKCTNY